MTFQFNEFSCFWVWDGECALLFFFSLHNNSNDNILGDTNTPFLSVCLSDQARWLFEGRQLLFDDHQVPNLLSLVGSTPSYNLDPTEWLSLLPKTLPNIFLIPEHMLPYLNNNLLLLDHLVDTPQHIYKCQPLLRIVSFYIDNYRSLLM